MSDKLKFEDGELAEADSDEATDEVENNEAHDKAKTDKTPEIPRKTKPKPNKFDGAIPVGEIMTAAALVTSKMHQRESGLKLTKPKNGGKSATPKHKFKITQGKFLELTSGDTTANLPALPAPANVPASNALALAQPQPTNVVLALPAAPATSKMYERESGLKFIKSKEGAKFTATKRKVKATRGKSDVPIPVSKALVPVEPASTALVPAKSTSTTLVPVAPANPVNTTALVPVNPVKSDSKLNFTEPDKKLLKLARKHDTYSIKLEQAREKLPAKITKVEQRFYTKKKGKNGKPEIKLKETKIRFDKEVIPFHEAKWNQPTRQPLPIKGAAAITSLGVSKLHHKIHQAEHENVGVKAAHSAELMGESAVRGSRDATKSAYRFYKNTPYRMVAKLEQKTLKTGIKLDYQKALRDNPKLKSSAKSRFFQKRQIKRKYAAALRKAKKSGQNLKATGNIINKAGRAATNIVRRNPIFLVKLGALLLIFFFVMSMVTMCMSIFSGGTGFVGALMYAADYDDIDAASVLYTELETDLRLYIRGVAENHPNFDEYRFDIGSIGHNPFELMAFLTAVYGEFTFAEVEPILRQIFATQYTLSLVPETEIRQRWEQTGWEAVLVGFDEADAPVWEWIPVYGWANYEWHILNVTLAVTPLSEVLHSLMNDGQAQHYAILMFSRGARQFVGNPFDFDWLPFMTSPYGYRIHPISGERQFHSGLDIALPTGTEIRAGFDGTVVDAGYAADSYGNFVIIESTDGIQALYAHCYAVFVSVGQSVERGDVIATVGNTGASTGSHLHMEVSRNGIRINPIFFVDFN